MKKTVDILSVISVISVGGLLALSILRNDKSIRLVFIYDWVSSVLIAFSIPLIFRSFSLVAKKDKLKPYVWLLIYGVIFILYFFVLFHFGFIERTKDMPKAIKENYSFISGTPQILSSSTSTLIIRVRDNEIDINRNLYKAIEEQNTYQFVFLPNSKYAINIIDENGISLLK